MASFNNKKFFGEEPQFQVSGEEILNALKTPFKADASYGREFLADIKAAKVFGQSLRRETDTDISAKVLGLVIPQMCLRAHENYLSQ